MERFDAFINDYEETKKLLETAISIGENALKFPLTLEERNEVEEMISEMRLNLQKFEFEILLKLMKLRDQLNQHSTN